jgi:hypothetical protein
MLLKKSPRKNCDELAFAATGVGNLARAEAGHPIDADLRAAAFALGGALALEARGRARPAHAITHLRPRRLLEAVDRIQYCLGKTAKAEKSVGNYLVLAQNL